MDDLITFLRARLDEDEQAAQSAMVHEGDWPSVVNAADYWDGSLGDYVACHDPARGLAEVEAKRSIIAFYEKAVRDAARPPLNNAVGETAVVCFEMAVRCVALPYRGHHDYRPEWAPE